MDTGSDRLFERLNQIADLIEPQEATYFNAWAKFSRSASMADYDAIDNAASRLNEFIESHIPEIAATTHNSTDTIRQVYRPRDEVSLWFAGTNSPSEFLRLVAKYRSFNEQYWTTQGWRGYTPKER